MAETYPLPLVGTLIFRPYEPSEEASITFPFPSFSILLKSTLILSSSSILPFQADVRVMAKVWR